MASGSRARANELNFQKLCDTFAEICPDFRRGPESANLESLDFANRVLFELGPKMRQLKQSGRDQMWRLVFNGGGSVYVYTYTFQKPITGQPRLGGEKLYLTLKQAGLLAASRFCSLLPLQHNPRDKVLLTPLARAVFDPPNITKIATALSTLFRHTIDTNDVVRAVVSSCQSDGFHLRHSQSHIALVAVGATTRDSSNRQKLRKKTIKQYMSCGKAFDINQYKIYTRYSKMADTVALESPIPDPEPPKPKPAGRNRNVSGVLRSIAKATDDPLTGETIDLKFQAPNSAKSAEVEGMATSNDVHLEGISMERMRCKLLDQGNSAGSSAGGL